MLKLFKEFLTFLYDCLKWFVTYFKGLCWDELVEIKEIYDDMTVDNPEFKCYQEFYFAIIAFIVSIFLFFYLRKKYNTFKNYLVLHINENPSYKDIRFKTLYKIKFFINYIKKK